MSDDRDTRDGDELVQAWQDQNHAYSFEGDSGLAKFEKLLGVIGYRGHSFKYGSPIEEFLSDNPGAVDGLVDFVAEYVTKNPEWREAMLDEVGPGEDDDCCPGCGNGPGDGINDECSDPAGCGHWRSMRDDPRIT